jgi:hypothetical protein
LGSNINNHQEAKTENSEKFNFIQEPGGSCILEEKNVNMCVDVQFLRFLAFLLAKICIKEVNVTLLLPSPVCIYNGVDGSP